MTRHTSIPVRQELPDVTKSPLPAPRGPISSLRAEIDRLFDAFEPARWRDFSLARLPDIGSDLNPAIDFAENGKAYVLRIEIPGIDPAKVEVRLANGNLTVSGEKSEEAEEKGEDYHLSERRWGSFRRSVRLPENIDRDAITAGCSQGVLTVTLPKSAAAQAEERKIDVKTA